MDQTGVANRHVIGHQPAVWDTVTNSDIGVMEYLNDYSDSRLKGGCVFCGGPEESRDHVPSRLLLDSPFPENLPVVPACWSCNNGFSRDEEYLACLVEAAAVGSTDPAQIRRKRVAKILRRSPKLRSAIDQGRTQEGGLTHFAVEVDRVRNVILKLAHGHAFYELGRPVRTEPTAVASWPIHLMDDEEREAFDAPHFPEMYSEVGSRGLQRLKVVQMTLQDPDGNQRAAGFLMNDWIEVQEGRYRYLAIDESDRFDIRLVIGEYMAAQVVWEDTWES